MKEGRQLRPLAKKLGRVLITVGALIFIGGLVITLIEAVVWFETGRMWQHGVWMDLPLGLAAVVMGPIVGVAGALVVHR